MTQQTTSTKCAAREQPYTMALPPWLQRMTAAFAEHNFQCYVVGGAIRDRLRGQAVGDYDLATDATPAQVQDIWRRTVPTGIRYGTVTLLSGKQRAEVTTFRSESQYLDNRHPQQIQFGTDIVEDLSRRDFTINAIAYDPMGERLIDPFDGAADIRKKIIRTVGEPQARLTEDALRILRAVRFATVLQFDIEPQTERALARGRDRIDAISAERIRDELERIVCSPYVRHGFALLARLRLLETIYAVPPLAQRLQSHTTLHTHIEHLLTVAATLPTDATHLRHALLWYGCLQQERGRAAAERLLAAVESQITALRYPRAHTQSVIHLSRMLYRLPPVGCSDGTARHFFFIVGRAHIQDMISLISALYDEAQSGGDSHGSHSQTARNTTAADRATDDRHTAATAATASHAAAAAGRTAAGRSATDRRRAHSHRLVSIATQQRILGYEDLAIDGHDLQHIGYEKGQLIGVFKRRAAEYVCHHPQKNTREDLTAYAQALLSEL